MQYTIEDNRESIRLSRAWENVIKELSAEVSNSVQARFLKPLKPVDINAGTVTIAAPGSFVKEWVKDKFIHRIQVALEAALEEPVVIDLTIEKSKDLSDHFPKQPELVFTSVPTSQVEDSGFKAEHFKPNDKYTFETFITGQSNRLAYAGARAITAQPGTKYNPLFIYGLSGLGKTHLLHSIAQEILSHKPGYPIVYISAQQFAEKFVHALQSNKIEEFRRQQRSISVWLVDDIQFIAGKDKTQEEIFHTFNYLHNLGKQIVLCSDRQPRDLFLMDERLRSRFESGLVADIQPPDAETRCAIILSKANQENIIIDHNIAMFLAERVPGNIRSLEGALIKVAAQASIEGIPVSMDLARKIIDRYYKQNPFTKPNMEQILELVSSHYNISIEDIKGNSRKAPIAHARHIAIYLTREVNKDSWKHIGSLFGNKDHTTIMHAYQKVNDMIDKDSQLKITIRAFIQTLMSGSRL